MKRNFSQMNSVSIERLRKIFGSKKPIWCSNKSNKDFGFQSKTQAKRKFKRMNLQLNRSHAHVNNIICRRINYWTTLTKPSIENRTSQRHFRYLEDAADGVRILIGAMVVENSCPVNFSFTPRTYVCLMSWSYDARINSLCPNYTPLLANEASERLIVVVVVTNSP